MFKFFAEIALLFIGNNSMFLTKQKLVQAGTHFKYNIFKHTIKSFQTFKKLNCLPRKTFLFLSKVCNLSAECNRSVFAFHLQ